MIFFAGGRPNRSSGAKARPPDASPGTFYSAMSNVDIEIQDGNPGAVAVGRYAQHCYLAHMDFHLGSGLAGIHDGGNVAYDLRIFSAANMAFGRASLHRDGNTRSSTVRLKAKPKPQSASMRRA